MPVSALFYTVYLFFCLEYLTLYTKFSRKQSIAPTYFGSLNILVATMVLQFFAVTIAVASASSSLVPMHTAPLSFKRTAFLCLPKAFATFLPVFFALSGSKPTVLIVVPAICAKSSISGRSFFLTTFEAERTDSSLL